MGFEIKFFAKYDWFEEIWKNFQSNIAIFLEYKWVLAKGNFGVILKTIAKRDLVEFMGFKEIIRKILVKKSGNSGDLFGA